MEQKPSLSCNDFSHTAASSFWLEKAEIFIFQLDLVSGAEPLENHQKCFPTHRRGTTKSLLAKTILTAKLSRLPALRRSFFFGKKIYLCIWFWHLKMVMAKRAERSARKIIKVDCQSAAKFTLWTHRGVTERVLQFRSVARDAGHAEFLI